MNYIPYILVFIAGVVLGLLLSRVPEKAFSRMYWKYSDRGLPLKDDIYIITTKDGNVIPAEFSTIDQEFKSPYVIDQKDLESVAWVELPRGLQD